MANKEYRFEVYVSDSTNDSLQNITGKYGSFSGETFTAEDCHAGMLCVRAKELPLEGYEEHLNNGNSWYMTKATTGGVSGLTGDRTGIYACNNYDVAKAAYGDNHVNFGGQILGIGLAADERGDFTELKLNEKYNFGKDNFSTLPSESATYATIENGLWAATASAPTDGSVYAKVISTKKRFIEGAYDGGQKIELLILRSAKA